MYVLPKGLESAWVAARGKGLVFRTGKHGSALVCSAVICRCLDIDGHLSIPSCPPSGWEWSWYVSAKSLLCPRRSFLTST